MCLLKHYTISLYHSSGDSCPTHSEKISMTHIKRECLGCLRNRVVWAESLLLVYRIMVYCQMHNRPIADALIIVHVGASLGINFV